MELPDPPEGWALKSLIEIDPDSAHAWSAQLWAEDAYVYGYGSTARFAMLDALRRIDACEYFERLSGMARFQGVDISKALEAIPKAQPTKGRRF
jgi:hypothetical protein